MNIIELATIAKKDNTIKVRRKSWEEGFIYVDDNMFKTDFLTRSPNYICVSDNLHDQMDIYFSLEELLADDWEVVE